MYVPADVNAVQPVVFVARRLVWQPSQGCGCSWSTNDAGGLAEEARWRADSLRQRIHTPRGELPWMRACFETARLTAEAAAIEEISKELQKPRRES
jgi:hypothetical protein